jgi:hypothetical protein
LTIEIISELSQRRTTIVSQYQSQALYWVANFSRHATIVQIDVKTIVVDTKGFIGDGKGGRRCSLLAREPIVCRARLRGNPIKRQFNPTSLIPKTTPNEWMG